MFKIAEIEHVALGWEIKVGDGVTADLSLFVNEVKIVKGIKIVEGEFTDSLEEGDSKLDIVTLLRKVSKAFEKTSISLPVEMVAVIEGRETEEAWRNISMAKVLRYVADMLE